MKSLPIRFTFHSSISPIKIVEPKNPNINTKNGERKVQEEFKGEASVQTTHFFPYWSLLQNLLSEESILLLRYIKGVLEVLFKSDSMSSIWLK